MKDSKRMAQVCTAIAKKHGIDLNNIYASVRLEMPGMDPLVIENVAPNHVRVTHYYTREDFAVPDPSMTFFLSPHFPPAEYGWYPTEIKLLLWPQPRVSMVVDPGDGSIKANIKAQAEDASFANTWATNIKEQEWLERGVCTAKDEGWPLIAVVDDRDEDDVELTREHDHDQG